MPANTLKRRRLIKGYFESYLLRSTSDTFTVTKKHINVNK